jgi:hypothetical protein
MSSSLLVCTEEGRLGLGHETGKEGDLLICILYGCSVLVVLWRFEGLYCFFYQMPQCQRSRALLFHSVLVGYSMPQG